ncbi:MAG: RNA polymerase sigma factor [Limisphaerales bacterium]
MTKKRIIEYWPHLPELPLEDAPRPDWKVERAVRWAVRRLAYAEREAVERFYFCGQKCDEIGAALGISRQRVFRLLKQARRELKRRLGPFVQKRYGVPVEKRRCQVCRSASRKAIEKLLKAKPKEETWKKVLQKLRTQFQIRTSAWNLARHLEGHRPKPPKSAQAGIAKEISKESTA